MSGVQQTQLAQLLQQLRTQWAPFANAINAVEEEEDVIEFVVDADGTVRLEIHPRDGEHLESGALEDLIETAGNVAVDLREESSGPAMPDVRVDGLARAAAVESLAAEIEGLVGASGVDKRWWAEFALDHAVNAAVRAVLDDDSSTDRISVDEHNVDVATPASKDAADRVARRLRSNLCE